MTIEQLCDFNNMRNKIREMLIGDDYQWLPLIRQGLWHWLNVLGQIFFFSKLENSIIRDSARREAELLIVPVNRGMSTDELAATTAIHAFPFWFFIVLDNQSDAAKHFKATRRNYPSFYDSWVYIHWQIRLAQKYISLLRERIPNNTMPYYTLEAIATEKTASIKKLQEELAKRTSWISLPEHTRLDIIGDSVQDWLYKLMDLPIVECYKKIFLTALNVERDLEDEDRRLKKTKKGRAEAGTVSLNEEIENAHGSKVSMMELLTAKDESLQTQQDVVEVVHTETLKAGFTNSQKKALSEILNATDIQILSAILRKHDATQEEIAEDVGCVQSKVSKAQGKFKRHKEKIKKILGLE